MSTFRPHAAADSTQRAVVLAEDDDDCREALARTLTQDGHRVVTMSSGQALLAHLHALRKGSERPAVVIADQRMPGMTGTYVLERMRQWGLRLPVVLITGFDDPEVLERAQKLGAAVLCKPIDGDDLCMLVRHCLARPASTPMRCCVCGSQLNLHGADDDGEVFFCGECHEAGHPTESAESWVDLGGGD